MDSNLNLDDMNLPDELVAGTSSIHIEKQPQQSTNGVAMKATILSSSGATSLQKVTLKPGSVTAHKAVIANQKPGSNQIVLIQGPGGASIPVKLISSSASTLTTNSQTIQTKVATIMNQQKKLMPAKTGGMGGATVVTSLPRKSINPSTNATVVNPPKVLISSSTGKLVPNHGLVRIATAPTTKPMTANEAKITEFIKRQQVNKVTTAPVAPKIHTVVDSHIKFKVVQSGQGSSKVGERITAPKPTQVTGQPQLQTINIPGKNVQYVRLLNPQPNTTIAIRTANGQQKILPAPPPGKVIIQKPGQHISIVNSNTPPAKPAIATTKPTAPAASDGEKSTEARKMIAVFRKGDIKSGMLPESGKVSTLTTSQLSQLKGAKIISAGENSKTNIVMLPPDYMKQLEDIKAGNKTPPEGSPMATTNLNTSSGSNKAECVLKKFFQISPTSNDEASRKRSCNCTKSQCLKLYCDCFANGEFCDGCNCKDCFNTLSNETDRNEAIQMCLERNPHAFKPKVTKSQHEDNSVRHSKGCNCKKSNCLKNYCECYEAKVACSDVCKCTGCRNDGESVPYYDSPSTQTTTSTTTTEVRTYTSSTTAARQSLTQPTQPQPAVIAQKRSGSPIQHHLPAKISATAAAGSVHIITSRPLSSTDSAAVSLPSTSSARPSTSSAAQNSSAVPSSSSSPLIPTKQPYNFMTQDVIEATVQCMIAQADDCQKRRVPQKWAEKMILEEFGRCLVEIIEFSSKPDNEGGVAAV